MRILVFLAFLGLSGPLAAQVSNDPALDPTLDPTLDPALTKAIQAAQETLPIFLKHALIGEGGLQVSLPAGPNGAFEQIWVTPFRQRADGRYEGIVATDPQFALGLAAGSTVVFERADITDWSAVIAGRGYGYFSLRAVLHRLDPDKARVLNLFLAETPLPASWR